MSQRTLVVGLAAAWAATTVVSITKWCKGAEDFSFSAGGPVEHWIKFQWHAHDNHDKSKSVLAAILLAGVYFGIYLILRNLKEWRTG